MEIPENCCKCRFCDQKKYGEYVGEDCGMHCYALRRKVFDTDAEARAQRHPDCPYDKTIIMAMEFIRELPELVNRILKDMADSLRRFAENDILTDGKVPPWCPLVGSVHKEKT